MRKTLICIFSVLLLSEFLPARGRNTVGAVDTDVNPDGAEVWLDGKALGQADDFDGWPQYLYLPPGTCTLEFRLEGYETFRATVKVEAWEVVHIKKQLARVPPSAVQETPNPVEEIGSDTPPPSEPGSRETARLNLTVSPDNSVIYLNGDFWLSGADLARMHSPLQIPAGRLTLLCYAPGYEETTKELDARPGELIEVGIVLVQKQ